MFWKILISGILLFATAVVPSNQITQIDVEKGVNTGNTGGGGGGSGGGYVYPRIEFPGRDIPRVFLGYGSGVSYSASYLAGFDRTAPALIKRVQVDNPSIVDISENEYNIVLRGNQYGETTVTVDVYHEFYDDIWVTTIIPVTVTQSVYTP